MIPNFFIICFYLILGGGKEGLDVGNDTWSRCNIYRRKKN